MFLYVRMALYAASMFFAGYGIGTFDAQTGDLTINIDHIAALISGAGTFVATFFAGRVSKARGGAT